MKIVTYLLLLFLYLYFKKKWSKKEEKVVLSPSTPPLYPKDILAKSKKESTTKSPPTKALFEEGKTNPEPVYTRVKTNEEEIHEEINSDNIYTISDEHNEDETSRENSFNAREAFISSIILQRPY